jgi:hypothetical protein
VPVKTGFVSHAVRFRLYLNPPASIKPGGVLADYDEQTGLTLSCGTVGAAIHYTTDGSFPRPGSGTTILYTSPLALASGTQLRAAAYVPGQNPGDVLELTLTD